MEKKKQLPFVENLYILFQHNAMLLNFQSTTETDSNFLNFPVCIRQLSRREF